MYRNILAAIDGSATSRRALQDAAALAEALNAKLTVMTVVLPLPGFSYRAGIDVAALEHAAEDEAAKLLRDAADELPQDISVTTILAQGHPGREIVRQIERGEHDLLVMGSRGRGRLISTLLGSVGGDVHFHAHVPMLVIHPGGEEDTL